MARINSATEPELIQGGMGVGISNWKLALAVALAGEKLGKPVLGVVSGVGLAITLVFRLRNGNLDARRALEAFPVPEIAQKILDRYWLKGSGKFRMPPKPELLVNGSEEKKIGLTQLIMVANFAEVWLAKQGHSSPIGINYLEKVQLPRLPEMFGAMLAGVDYVLMGAGIPLLVPGALDNLAAWKKATYKIDVAGSDKHPMTFDPKTIIPEPYRRPLTRPKFLAIISTHVLALALTSTRATGEVNGFVVEGPTAGGHNAPARGKEISESGEPVYGERDKPDLAKIQALGKPFWLAGGYASPEKLQEALALGAAGIQVGSAFALCNESGMREDIKRELKKLSYSGDIKVRANPVVSSSGFPFQVVDYAGSLSDQMVLIARTRSCSLGYLAQAYAAENKRSGIGFRCPAEPVASYAAKGGKAQDTEGVACLCNGLAATAQDGQRPESPNEPFIVTLGKDQSFIRDLMGSEDGSYSAEDVARWIFGL